jgi:copper oxidase (laccase) domain-containing protein
MVCGGRTDGDFADPATAVAGGASRALADVPWTWLRQVHGSAVVVVDRPGANRGQEADAAVTCCAGAGLVVLTADCAPVGLSSPEGVAGVLHAGWRGLMAGVVGATVAAMRALGATRVQAALGPCIWPHAYRFSDGDLADVVSAFGPAVRSVDAAGSPALDLPAAVAVALERSGAALVAKAGICTHCSDDHWSWRAGRDQGRQATVVWRPPAPPTASPGAAPGSRL